MKIVFNNLILSNCVRVKIESRCFSASPQLEVKPKEADSSDKHDESTDDTTNDDSEVNM